MSRWPSGPARITSRVKVNPETGCWDWQGVLHKTGYGRITHGGEAHRISYETFVGPIPDGLQLDHLCRRPCCVNPDHLEPVTQAENMRRRYADYTHCASGHEFTPENTYTRPSGTRQCRACNAKAARDYKARRAAARNLTH